MLCLGFLIIFSCKSSVLPPTDTYCTLYHPVYLSHQDTRKTKEDTDTNNRIYKKICT